MLVWSVAALMEADELLAHQDMLRGGDLVAYDPETMHGRVIYISHQWTGYNHADGTRVQLRTLQGVLGRLMKGEQSVEADIGYQKSCGSSKSKAKAVSAAQWKRALPGMFVWIDYCCIPQPSAGKLTEDLWIPQEAAAGTGQLSFIGSLRRSARNVFEKDETTKLFLCEFRESESKLNQDVSYGKAASFLRKTPAKPDKTAGGMVDLNDVDDNDDDDESMGDDGGENGKSGDSENASGNDSDSDNEGVTKDGGNNNDEREIVGKGEEKGAGDNAVTKVSRRKLSVLGALPMGDGKAPKARGRRETIGTLGWKKVRLLGEKFEC